MQPEYLSSSHNGNASNDRATAALLTGGGGDGVSAFVLRRWRPGTNPPEPVFVTWLLNIGCFCLTVRYGRFSLKRGEWCIDTGSGPRSAPSPLEQARVEALLTREFLEKRLNRPAACCAGPGLLGYGPRPAHRALGPTKPRSAAVRPGRLHRAIGRCRGKSRAPPATGKVAGPGGDIRPRRGRRSRWRRAIP